MASNYNRWNRISVADAVALKPANLKKKSRGARLIGIFCLSKKAYMSLIFFATLRSVRPKDGAGGSIFFG